MSSKMLSPGQSFPNFSLPNQDNQMMELGDFAGKWLVIYVYPKDDTPGCTLEGRSFSSAKPDFDQVNAQVIGLSEDDVSSHKNFCNKFGLNIPLLADPQGQLLKAVGIEQSEYKGTMYWNRTTFIVDPRGTLRKVYQNVNPENHEKVVLEDIKKLQSH
jgi:peroxiredoxin Q/BCP